MNLQKKKKKNVESDFILSVYTKLLLIKTDFSTSFSFNYF